LDVYLENITRSKTSLIRYEELFSTDPHLFVLKHKKGRWLKEKLLQPFLFDLVFRSSKKSLMIFSQN